MHQHGHRHVNRADGPPGQRLLEDLAAQQLHAQRLEQSQAAAELARAERGSLTMEDRLSGAVGAAISIQLRTGDRVSGMVRRVGERWVELVEAGEAQLVQLGAVRQVESLPGRTRPAGGASRQSLRSRLRQIEDAGRPVTVGADGSLAHGMLIGVWSDHCELFVQREQSSQVRSAPGSGRAAGSIAIMYAALEWIRHAVV